MRHTEDDSFAKWVNHFTLRATVSSFIVLLLLAACSLSQCSSSLSLFASCPQPSQVQLSLSLNLPLVLSQTPLLFPSASINSQLLQWRIKQSVKFPDFYIEIKGMNLFDLAKSGGAWPSHLFSILPPRHRHNLLQPPHIDGKTKRCTNDRYLPRQS